MSITAWIAVATIFAVIAALLKKFEVRTTLLSAGIFLCLISLAPMQAFDQFAKMMTSATLVQAITAAMGFAFLMSYTKADLHLVTLLAAPLKHLGVFLIPACTIVTLIVNTAIPSAAGCAVCGKHGVLKDRKGKSFPVVCSPYPCVEILNSVPVYLADKMNDIKTDFAQFYFTDESREQVRSVISLYQSGRPATFAFTRGLYYRGVF